MKKIFIICGEQSGDMHSAALVADLKKIDDSIEFSGFGGRYLKEQNIKIFRDIGDLSVIGVFEVLKRLFFFIKLIKKTVRHIIKENPDAVLLVDYPGFNLKVAEKLRKLNYNGKIIYYISPMIWAWHTSRVYKIDKLIDRVMVIFKFEKEFYDSHIADKNKAVFTGNPLMKRISQKFYCENSKKINSKFIALLPGSRVNEINKILPPALKACEKFLKTNPEYKVLISASDIDKIVYIKKLLTNENKNKFFIVAGCAYSLLQYAQCAIVASGTATLETAIIGCPMIALYKVNYFTGLLGKILLKVKYISLVNIVMNDAVIPELIQGNMTPEKIYNELLKYTNESGTNARVRQNLKKIRGMLNSDISDNILGARTFMETLK